jgi:hypothetical protein
MGDISKPPGVGDLAHMQVRQLDIQQLSATPLQSSKNNELVKGHRLTPKQPMQVAFGNAVHLSDLANTQ